MDSTTTTDWEVVAKGEASTSQYSGFASALRWRYGKNCKLFAAFYSFIILGAIDASYGALLPHLKDYYNLSYILVSLIFLPPLVGYIAAACLNEAIHRRFGPRGVAVIGPLCHLILFIVAALHPPYPVVVIVIAISGFGNGILDAAWNAWVGDMEKANEFMGILHSLYGVGAVASPLIATTLITKGHAMWYRFYYVMALGGVIELLVCCITFWDYGPKTFLDNPDELEESALWLSVKNPTVWIMSAIGFVYMGTEVSVGGWMPTFLINSRGASEFAGGMALVGFWLGIVIGTALLGFAISRLGARLAVSGFLIISIVLQLIGWLVPTFYAYTITTALTGFWMGPIFPTAIVVAVQLLEPKLHVTAIGIISTIGCSGSTVFPFIVGAIAEKAGVKILPPFVFSLFCGMLLIWLLAPQKCKTRSSEMDDIEKNELELHRRASVI